MPKTKSHGGKLNRTEIVHIRLNPRARFALELLARSDNRTVSSYLELLVNNAIDSQQITILKTLEEIEKEQGNLTPDDLTGQNDNYTKPVLVSEALKVLWHVDEPHRFINLAFYAPHLLTYHEEITWEFIKYCDYYWNYYYVDAKTVDGRTLGKQLTRIFDPTGAVWERLDKHWKMLSTGDFKGILAWTKENGEKLEAGNIIEHPEDEPTEVIVLKLPSNISQQKPDAAIAA